ncbi:carbohydrate ABC transporter permease [Rugosimonospora acidiphila]|uniref:Carbohydrate ABC transporter permease n=1 Tax=Rugosimonospora acidiphila TaxID=556531 RepID=A0ABP9SDG4_9ACTN
MKSTVVLRTVSNVLKVFLALVVVFPILWMIVTALKPSTEVVTWPPTFLPRHWHWGNLAEVERAGPFLRWYFNSVLIAAITVAGNLVFGVPAAFAFARLKFRGRNLLFLVVLGSLMIPGEVLLIPLFVFLNKLGWVDTYQALTVPFLANGFVIFLLRQFFETIPRELEEAAVIDGCGLLRIMWHVVVPLSRPALAVSAFFVFIGSWNSYLYPLIVTRSESMRTVTVGLSLFKSESGTNWPLLMSAATLIALPAMIAFLLIERHLKDTMALSGVRG